MGLTQSSFRKYRSQEAPNKWLSRATKMSDGAKGRRINNLRLLTALSCPHRT
jgi:hypothetical protein